MKINNEFTVNAPVERAWGVLLDLERVAPCLPGAAIQGSEGDEYKGTIKVKIGPISSTYRGTVKIEEADEENHRAVLEATGRDARGQGTASATITSKLEQQGEQTKVSVETDMHLTGRAAQFGRGIAQDVATKMLGQFAACLEEKISGEEEPEAAVATAGGPTEESAETSGNGTAPMPPAAGMGGVGGTAGRVVSGDPGTLGGGTVEGAVVSGPGATEATPEERVPAAEREEEPAPAGGGSGARQEEGSAEPEDALDLFGASYEAVLKRAVPLVLGLGVLGLVIWLLGRRRS